MKTLTKQNYAILRKAGCYAMGAYYWARFYANYGDVLFISNSDVYMDFSDTAKPLKLNISAIKQK